MTCPAFLPATQSGSHPATRPNVPIPYNVPMRTPIRTPRQSAGRVRKRLGISLLEVLVSIGVLSVGLLGILALMPAASLQAKKGIEHTASANLGHRAFHEMNVRWSETRPAGSPAWPQFHVIDPIGIANAAASGLSGRQILQFVGLPNVLRTTFPDIPYTSPAIKDVFQSSDDLFFGDHGSLENAPPNPPQQVALKDSTGALVKRKANNNYSWLATVVPKAGGFETVSVAVVHKRAPGMEYSAEVDQSNSSIVEGLGEVHIPFPKGNTSAFEAWKNVRSGHWILLISSVVDQYADPGAVPLGTAEWYRVLGSGTTDIDNDGSPDRLTYSVQGVDWNGLYPNPPPPNARTITTHAVLIPNVIAVYSRNYPLKP